MKLKNFKLTNFMAVFLVAMLYPTVKTLISTANRMMILSDSMMMIAFSLLIVGVLYHLYQHGDFKATSYVMRRTVNKDIKDYQAYSDDEDEKRKDSFNYPLFVGLLFIVIAFVLAQFA